MKRLIAFSLATCLTSAVLGAGPNKIIVHGGSTDQTHAIVRFKVPEGWAPEYTMSGREGTSVTKLQVNQEGEATMVVAHIAKGETITFRPAPFTPPSNPYGMVVEKNGSLLDLTHWHNGKQKPVFSYQMEPGAVPEGVPPVFMHGAHLHPVYSPSGRLVTGNHPADHRWHRGIWMAWTHTEYEGQKPDFWNMGKVDKKEKNGGTLMAEVRFESLLKRWSGPVHGGFVSQHRFIDHNSGAAKDVLKETWEVTTYAIPDGEKPAMFVIDLVSTQTCAGSSPLKLPKYHYGGLGVRGHANWDPVNQVSMLTSNGDNRIKGDSTKAKWVHMGGQVDGQTTGMAILIHPDNYRFPQPLRLNPKNPQLCIAPSQDGDWAIEPGKPYVSKYRFLIMDGEPDNSVISLAWQGYSEPLKVTLE